MKKAPPGLAGEAKSREETPKRGITDRSVTPPR
jgi:hypothetical protein